MTKLWNEKVKRIEVYKRNTGKQIASFFADDAISLSPRNYFYLNGEEVYWYDERQCYYKSFEYED